MICKYTRVFLQITAQSSLLLLHISAEYRCHLQGAVNVRVMYCVLCWLSITNAKMSLRVSFISKQYYFRIRIIARISELTEPGCFELNLARIKMCRSSSDNKNVPRLCSSTQGIKVKCSRYRPGCGPEGG